MREAIQRFMHDCPAAKRQTFSNNPFGNFVRTEIPEIIYKTGLVDREKYLISASVGAGNWALIPWICIFDRTITTSATKGIYIVYLLSKDSKRLYLTFNQGCTDIRKNHNRRETIEIMHQKAYHIQSTIQNHGFITGCDIDLGDSLTELGVFYKEGTIFYKQYDVNAIPDENTLCNDLSRMMDVYKDYSRSINNADVTGSFDSWTVLDENTAVKTCDKSFYDYNGSGVPKEICWFFNADNLDPGQTKPLKLYYLNHEFEGIIRIESSDRRRVRIFWSSDLGKELKAFDKQHPKATFHRRGNDSYEITMNGEVAMLSTKEQINNVKAFIAAKGFTYGEGLIENFYLSLKSKPFVILAGTSGTGKTRLVRLFAEAIGASYKQVAVRPDWSDSTDLFGHVDLNGCFVPGAILDFLWEAQNKPDKPHILCLDEMNLARVEYYLSDFLSVIETREMKDDKIISELLITADAYGTDEAAKNKYGKIYFPENLYIVGTVNMDETTFPFSRKVLDRANTIEFNYVDLVPMWHDETDLPEIQGVNNDFLRSKYLLLNQCLDPDKNYVYSACSELEKINRILQKANAHVGYRVRDEIVFYLLNNQETGLLNENEALDNEIMQKILPRIQGSSASIKDMLCELFKELAGDYEGYQTESNNTADRMLDKLRKNTHIRYPKCAEKIAFMMRRFEEDGFTSYWL